MLVNQYFQLACFNTLKLIAICVPLFLVLSILISLLSLHGSKAGAARSSRKHKCSIEKAGRNGRIKKGDGRMADGLGRLVRKLSILPLFLPSVSVVAAFLVLFEKVESELPIYSIFLWKYIGMGVVILVAAFSSVEPEFYEAARMDGAGPVAIHAYITLPVCVKPIQFAMVLGVVYCFRTFRESYLYYGANYPPDYSYTLQYYMNNQFLKLNYQSMAAASVMITLLLAGFVALCGWRKKERA